MERPVPKLPYAAALFIRGMLVLTPGEITWVTFGASKVSPAVNLRVETLRCYSHMFVGQQIDAMLNRS